MWPAALNEFDTPVLHDVSSRNLRKLEGKSKNNVRVRNLTTLKILSLVCLIILFEATGV